jgi:hypothetical protein
MPKTNSQITKAKNLKFDLLKRESSVHLWEFSLKEEAQTAERPNRVIHITARTTPSLLFWNRIVALQIWLRSYGALPLVFMVISLFRANHLIGSGLTSYNDESQLNPRRRPFPRSLAPILLEASCNRCTISPPAAS